MSKQKSTGRRKGAGTIWKTRGQQKANSTPLKPENIEKLKDLFLDVDFVAQIKAVADYCLVHIKEHCQETGRIAVPSQSCNPPPPESCNPPPPGRPIVIDHDDGSQEAMFFQVPDDSPETVNDSFTLHEQIRTALMAIENGSKNGSALEYRSALAIAEAFYHVGRLHAVVTSRDFEPFAYEAIQIDERREKGRATRSKTCNERNPKLQRAVDALVKKGRGLSHNRACEIVAEKHDLSFSTVKNATVNEYPRNRGPKKR